MQLTKSSLRLLDAIRAAYLTILVQEAARGYKLILIQDTCRLCSEHMLISCRTFCINAITAYLMYATMHPQDLHETCRAPRLQVLTAEGWLSGW